QKRSCRTPVCNRRPALQASGVSDSSLPANCIPEKKARHVGSSESGSFWNWRKYASSRSRLRSAAKNSVIGRRSRAPSSAYRRSRLRGVELAQHIHQRSWIHRLHHVLVESRLFRLPPVLILSPAGHGDEGHVLAPWLL